MKIWPLVLAGLLALTPTHVCAQSTPGKIPGIGAAFPDETKNGSSPWNPSVDQWNLLMSFKQDVGGGAGATEIDVRTIGMRPGGQDNSPFVSTLVALAGAVVNNTPGPVFVFPPTPGQTFTYWYFSQPFVTLSGGTVDCKGRLAETSGSSILIFPPGVDGVVQEDAPGFGQNDITRCTITSLGGGSANIPTPGSNSITGIGMNFTDNTFTTPSGCHPQGGECAFGVGDGVILVSQSVIEVAPGAYVSASNPGARTATLAAPYTILSNSFLRPQIYDLPASQKYTVQTITGSNTATVTAGPRPVQVGDMLWSDAFLFGASVETVSSTTAFPQTITVDNVTLTGQAPAHVTHTSGSPGQMWLVPAGVERRVQGAMHQSAVTYFPFALRMTCSAGTVPETGCNSSFDQENGLFFSMVGRLVRGDNSGVSTSIANVYASNSLIDEVEAGTVGSTYLSEENNSQDSGTSLYGTLVMCSIGQSTFIGSYLSGQGPESCLGSDADGNPSLVAPPTNGHGALFIAPLVDSPYPAIGIGEMRGGWTFNGESVASVIATVATAAGNTVIAVPTNNEMQNGMIINDVTTPAAIPSNTTIVSHFPGSITLSHPLAGAGIQIGDTIKYHALVTGVPSLSITGGINNANGNGNMLTFNIDGSSPHVLTMSYDGYGGSWLFGAMRMFGFNYLGYNPGFVQNGLVFPIGFQIGNQNEDFVGMERLIDGGSIIPTDPSHLQGDARINSKPTPGGNWAWADTPSFTTSLSASVTTGVTTSVSVAACPSPSLPAGTPIIDSTGASFGGFVILAHELGTLSSCISTTLTFQAAAVNSGVNGDAIQFLQWRPAARIANDVAGTSWPVASPVVIASLAACGATTVGFGVVTNGVTVGTAGYGAAVSATGAVTRPVFCDGSSWTYH